MEGKVWAQGPLCDNVSYHKRTKCLAVETSLLHLLRGGSRARVTGVGGVLRRSTRLQSCGMCVPFKPKGKQKNVGQSP